MLNNTGISTLAVAGLMALWKTKVPDFASGGVVYGEILARVGEYSGAEANPEIIAPLNRLQLLFQALRPNQKVFLQDRYQIYKKMKCRDIAN